MSFYFYPLRLWAFAAVLLVSACAGPAEQRAAETLVVERLSLMDEVAAYKWTNELPIEDASREEIVIANARDAAIARGLAPDAATLFFRTQIEAAKDIQTYWFQKWRADGGPTDAPDLAGEIRPELLRLGEAIVRAIADCRVKSEPVVQFSVQGLSSERGTQLHDAFDGLTPRSCDGR